jgi:hypothetical protein
MDSPQNVKNVKNLLDKSVSNNRVKGVELMRIRKVEKVKFEDVVKLFNFNQFYEICKIFGIDVVDKESFAQIMADAKEQNINPDLSKVKMRRDFDKMEEELVKYYNNLPRRNRRQIDPIIAKIVWGNKKANQIAETLKEGIVSDYNAAVAQLDEVQETIKENSENTNEAAAVLENDE